MRNHGTESYLREIQSRQTQRTRYVKVNRDPHAHPVSSFLSPAPTRHHLDVVAVVAVVVGENRYSRLSTLHRETS